MFENLEGVKIFEHVVAGEVRPLAFLVSKIGNFKTNAEFLDMMDKM